MLLLMFITVNVLPQLPSLSKSRILLVFGLPFKLFVALAVTAFMAGIARFLLHAPALAIKKLLENDLELSLTGPSSGVTEVESEVANRDSKGDYVSVFVRVVAVALALGCMVGGVHFFIVDKWITIGIWLFALFFSYVFQKKLRGERLAYRAYFATLRHRLHNSVTHHSRLILTEDEPKLPQKLEGKEGRCPVCGCNVGKNEPAHSCPRCQTLHHRECWDYSGGCAIFGCSKRGWQGKFDPAIFSKIRTMAERWQVLFRRQWLAFGVAAFAALIAVFGKIIPLGQLGRFFFVLGSFSAVIALITYLFSMPKTILLQRSLERELNTSLEPPQHQARAVIARLTAPSIDEVLVVVVRAIVILSLILTIILPLLAKAFPRLWVDPITLKEIVVLFVIGVLIPQGSLHSSQRRSKYLQSVRNRLMATFNVYRKDQAVSRDKAKHIM